MSNGTQLISPPPLVDRLWLDSAYPLDKPDTDPGIKRGDCPGTSLFVKSLETIVYFNSDCFFKVARKAHQPICAKSTPTEESSSRMRQWGRLAAPVSLSGYQRTFLAHAC